MASPLALLAATCSKIGSQEHQQLLGGGKAGQQIKLSNSLSAALLQQLQQQQSETTATVASQLSPMTPRDPLAASPSPPQHHQQQPQVITGITLAQLQNLLPLQQQLQVSAANDITQQLQGQTVKTFTSSAGLSNPTVVSVQGVPGQFIQVRKFK